MVLRRKDRAARGAWRRLSSPSSSSLSSSSFHHHHNYHRHHVDDEAVAEDGDEGGEDIEADEEHREAQGELKQGLTVTENKLTVR